MKEFELEENVQYGILGGGQPQQPHIPFEDVKTAFKMIGFRDDDLNSIFGILAGILHLGQIEFAAKTDKESNQDGSELMESSKKTVDTVSRLLGVPAETLTAELTTSNLTSRGEIISKINTCQEAYSSRDSLAKGLYSRLFDYIVNNINKLLSFSLAVYGDSNTVGILDIFGFENNGIQ